MYNIVLSDNKDFVLASCKTYELACARLKEMIETDKYLAKYYGWEKIPTYEIIRLEKSSMLSINGRSVLGTEFAYDGCHKIYIIEDMEDVKNATEYGYKILPISEIIETYNNSCQLRFISNWKLDKQYVKQGEKALFEKEEINYV